MHCGLCCNSDLSFPASPTNTFLHALPSCPHLPSIYKWLQIPFVTSAGALLRDGIHSPSLYVPLFHPAHLLRVSSASLPVTLVSTPQTSPPALLPDALMDKAAQLLLAECQKLGLLQPGGFIPTELSAQLEAEGELEEFGLQLCDVLAALGEHHYKCLEKNSERRNLYLTQVGACL